MKKQFLTITALSILSFITACGGSELQGDPVALPIPFSGTLTADTNILIAEGAPNGVPGSTLNAALKDQTNNLQTSWNLFDSTSSDLCGTVSFHSFSDPVVTPMPGGGVTREYSLDTTVTGAGTVFEVHSNMECIENRTPAAPTQESIDLANSISGATVDVRKLACSGNIDSGQGDFKIGQLLNGNFVVDTITLADGSTIFNTQRESNVTIDGTSFCGGAEVKGDVLLTLVVQGFSVFLPNRDGFTIDGEGPIVFIATFPFTFPGSDEIRGYFTQYVHDAQFVFDESGVAVQFSAQITYDLILNDSVGSICRVRKSFYEATVIPAIEEVLEQVVKDNFMEDTFFSDRVFIENGGHGFHETSFEEGTIDFNSDQDVTGFWRDLFNANGSYSIQSRSLAMTNPTESSPPSILMPLIFTITKAP